MKRPDHPATPAPESSCSGVTQSDQALDRCYRLWGRSFAELVLQSAFPADSASAVDVVVAQLYIAVADHTVAAAADAADVVALAASVPAAVAAVVAEARVLHV